MRVLSKALQSQHKPQWQAIGVFSMTICHTTTIQPAKAAMHLGSHIMLSLLSTCHAGLDHLGHGGRWHPQPPCRLSQANTSGL